MAENNKDRLDTDAIQGKVEFHYIKSNYFRVIHADGVYGGATPRGFIHMDFFSERSPIPQKVTQEVTQSGQLGQEVGSEGKKGIVREVEVGVVINLEHARSLVSWLQERIRLIEEATTIAREENTNDV